MKFEIDLPALDAPGKCYTCPMIIVDSWGRDRCAVTYKVIAYKVTRTEDSVTHGSVWVEPENCPLKVKGGD